VSLTSKSRLLLALPAVALWLAACGEGNTDVRHYRVAKPKPAAAAPAPMATNGGDGAAINVPPPTGEANLTWKAPDGWREGKASSMRLASYGVPFDGGEGDLSIIRLNGVAGGFVPNINRWRGQVGLPAADEASIRAAATEGKSPLAPFTVVKLKNPDNGKGMLAAVYAIDDATLFVKLTAPETAIDGLEAAFTDFCATLAEASK